MDRASDVQELQLHWSRFQTFLAGWSAEQEELVRRMIDRGGDVVCVRPQLADGIDIQVQEKVPLSPRSPLTPRSKAAKEKEKVKQKEKENEKGFPYESNGTAEMSLTGYHIRRKVKTRLGYAVRGVVNKKMFEWTSAAVIMANAVTIGVAADYNMKNIGKDTPTYLTSFEFAFTCFYTIEIVLRVQAQGCDYFRDEDSWRWNVFDLILVAQGLWDQVQSFVMDSSGGAMANLSFLRLLRLTKMLKLLRMIRLMRSFKELRLILSSVFGCVKSVMWATTLIVAVSYMFGVAFVQACTTYLESNTDGDNVVIRDIGKYWSSIGKTMITLFACATGGLDWQIAVECFYEVGSVFYALFLVYIFLFVFVISNTISSVFLEAMLSHADKDHQMIIEMQMEKKQDYIDKVQVFFNEIDVDGDGDITYDEFCAHMSSPHLVAFLSSLEIEIADAKNFFQIMSDQAKRKVDVETFVVGCIKLRGAAKSMDLMDLVYAHREATEQTMNHLSKVENALDAMQSKVHGLMSVVARQEFRNEWNLTPQRLAPSATSREASAASFAL